MEQVEMAVAGLTLGEKQMAFVLMPMPIVVLWDVVRPLPMVHMLWLMAMARSNSSFRCAIRTI